MLYHIVSKVKKSPLESHVVAVASLPQPRVLTCITSNRSREDMMRSLITLADSCDAGTCPGIDQWTDTGDFQIRGYRVAPEDRPAGLPVEEDVVMIPRDVLPALITQLRNRLAQQGA